MKFKEATLLVAISVAAVIVHGYHPNAEDAAIYLPGVEKNLHPELFPFNQQFFLSHAHLTIFPNLIADSARVSHLSLYWVLLCWHLISIFLLLFACWRLSAHCTESLYGRWASVAVVAGLLTLPVAGTALYIMDQYVNPRNLEAFAGVLAIAFVLESRYIWAAAILLVGAAIHPFMAFFAAGYCALLVLFRIRDARSVTVASALPLSFLYPKASPAYHLVAVSHPYHYLLRWQWYEWLGAIGPLVILWVYSRSARRKHRFDLDLMCRGLMWMGILSLLAAFVLSVPDRFETLARIQPLRSFYLVYLLLLIVSGAMVGEYVLKQRVVRWLALFLPMCVGMFISQRMLFPESAHVEWPGASSRNSWVQAFEWARGHTPNDAIFALDPDHMRIPGEDANGFRAIAQRSMLADKVKDSGAVSMFPPLADEWLRQVEAQKNWKTFQMADYRRLQSDYGANWFVLQKPGPVELDCPYANRDVAVCRLGSNISASKQLQP